MASNHALDAGGGIEASIVSLTNSTVRDNRAWMARHYCDEGGCKPQYLERQPSPGRWRRDRGGICVSQRLHGQRQLRRNVGGGVQANRVSLVNVTVTDNAAGEGGGLDVAFGGQSDIRNTIVAGNFGAEGPDVWGDFISAGHNLIGDPTGSNGFVNGVNGDQVGTAAEPPRPEARDRWPTMAGRRRLTLFSAAARQSIGATGRPSPIPTSGALLVPAMAITTALSWSISGHSSGS